MRIISSIFMLLIVLVGVSFACLNAQDVAINLYLTQLKLPLSLLLVLVLGLGMLVGYLIIGFKVLRLKRENSRLRGKVNLAEKEVENLRAIPLKDSH